MIVTGSLTTDLLAPQIVFGIPGLTAVSRVSAPPGPPNLQPTLMFDDSVWDNCEQVQVTNTRRPGSMVDVIPRALRRAITMKELTASNGAYQANDEVFLIAARFIQPSNAPEMGDLITPADGQVFTVIGQDFIVQRNVYRFTTRNLAIAFNLQDVIDIQRPAITFDNAGVRIKLWPDNAPPLPVGGSVLYSKLACRVQEIEATITDERGIRGLLKKYTVIVARQISVTNEDRIAWTPIGQTGQPVRYLEIRGYHNPERIDELPSIDAEGVP
jgi:hypothetical protein